MKRKICLVFYLVLFLLSIYSYERTFFTDWTKECVLEEDSVYFNEPNTFIYSLEKGYYLIISEFQHAYFTDNKTFIRIIYADCCSMENFEQKINQQIKAFRLGDFYTYVFDLNYDNQLDILNYAVSGMAVSLKIKTLNTDEYLFYSEMYKSFQNVDIQFCIIKGKRGFKYKQPDEDNIAFWSFFYWSPTEQRYILDETVTQEQLKNAYCPEEYFAYNGLDFSKLDKCLNQSDIKDLTPAQLRLMRNAIYARHGRKFSSIDLQSLWECYTWYKPNPDYSDSLLTKTDKENIKLIQAQEKITGVYVPDLPK